jgi:hypothetical protein
MSEPEDNAEPLRFLSPAYRKMRAAAENGHPFTLDEIENIVSADPATARAFADMAEAVRAGRDLTVAEVAQRARVPEGFIIFLVQAFIAGMVAERQAETLQ